MCNSAVVVVADGCILLTLDCRVAVCRVLEMEQAKNGAKSVVLCHANPVNGLSV